MVTQYQKLFEIRCRHTYFGDGICHALQLTPTAECQRRLDRSGCLFRQAVGGGSVFCETPPSWQSANELPPLTFALTDAKGQLASCTDLGAAATAAPDLTVYYFNNLADHGTETIDGQEFRLLHPTGNAFANGALPVRPPRFVYRCAEPLQSAAVQIFDPLGREVWNLRTPAPEIAALSLDVSDLAEGRYQLKINGADPYDFYLTGMAPGAMWGLIEIFPGANAWPASFVLSLAPRKSFWRYYLVSQSPADRLYDGYQITLGPPKGVQSNGTAPIAFSAPVRQRFNGRDAWVFESADPIPLYEYPGDHYEVMLKNNGRSSGPALPYARAEATRLNKSPNGELRYCSEIYVYR